MTRRFPMPSPTGNGVDEQLEVSRVKRPAETAKRVRRAAEHRRELVNRVAFVAQPFELVVDVWHRGKKTG